MRRFTSLLMVFVLLSFISCATAPPKEQTPAYLPSFDYKPPTGEAVGSADVTFALCSANYTAQEPWTEYWPFTDFSKNMELDFQEMLMGRGFTVRGPFHTYDELTFTDKKGSDLVLTPILDVTLKIGDLKKKENFKIIGENTFSFWGTAIISGRVSLSVNESLTNERMWFKSIDIPMTEIAWEGQNEYKVLPGIVDISDKGFTNAVAPEVEKVYLKIMETAWKYLDPEEMQMVKSQAADIKERKVY